MDISKNELLGYSDFAAQGTETERILRAERQKRKMLMVRYVKQGLLPMEIRDKLIAAGLRAPQDRIKYWVKYYREAIQLDIVDEA